MKSRCSLKIGYSFVLLVLTLSIFMMVTLLFPATAGAQDDRSFYFPSVIIDAEVFPDGSMSITEKRTYSFNGTFRGAWGFINRTGNTEIIDVRVGESGMPYRQVAVGTQDIPGTYYVEYMRDQVYIDWSYSASNEQRTFIIEYLVKNAVIVHDDVAELYWEFIGDQSDVRTNYAQITLTLPGGANREEIRVWGHGPLYGDVSIVSSDTVTWVIDGLPARTYLEGRVVFPTQLVPQATNKSGRIALPDILAEEEKWAREANLQRTMARSDFYGGPILLVLMIVFYIITRKRAISSPTAYQGDYYRELVGDYSPAEAGYIHRLGKTAPEDFTATILDLSRRNHLKLEEYQGETGFIWKRSFTDYRVTAAEGRDQMKSHEKLLHDYIFNKVGAGSPEGTTFKDLENYSRKNNETAVKFNKDWTKDIKKAAEAHQFFEGTAWPGIIAGIIITILGFILFFGNFFVTGFVAAFGGPFLLVGSVMIKKLTPKGADHYAKWKAFRQFLLHFSQLDRSTIPAMAVWEHYLVYAVVMGVAKQVMDQLNLVFPELKSDAARIWPAYGMLASNPVSFNKLTSTLDNSYRTAFRSSTSSGSGGGGGFSGGGGGGGGGGFGAR